MVSTCHQSRGSSNTPSGFILQKPELKVEATEDTMSRIHCCGHKYFSVCLHTQQNVSERIRNILYVLDFQGTKSVSDFFQKHFVSATNFVFPRLPTQENIMSSNVSSFATTLRPVLILQISKAVL